MLQTKRYVGNDLARLYRRVRNELGEDAMIHSTRALHREGGAPLIEIQAGPPMDGESLPFELQQAMLSTVLSRVAPGMKIPELEDLVLRGVLGPSAATDIHDEMEYAPAFEASPAAVAVEHQVPRAAASAAPLSSLETQLLAAGLSEAAADAITTAFPGLAPQAALASYLRRLPVSYPDEYETAIVVIDGPHGAGRSTAMLRMALDCSEAGRNAVAVSVDATRREPADVLAGYAEVMGIDFVGAPDDRSFERAIRKARRGSVLFVDGAPGWTPPAFVTAPVFRYVAVPAHWQSHALKTWMRSAGHGSYAGAIPTFTDIATELTPAVSTLVALGTGIAFLSSGSDISSGIAVADANAIASGIFSMSTGGRTDGRLVASA